MTTSRLERVVCTAVAGLVLVSGATRAASYLAEPEVATAAAGRDGVPTVHVEVEGVGSVLLTWQVGDLPGSAAEVAIPLTRDVTPGAAGGRVHVKAIGAAPLVGLRCTILIGRRVVDTRQGPGSVACSVTLPPGRRGATTV